MCCANLFSFSADFWKYENGEDIEKDLEKAIYWYNKAAKNGNEKAQYNLGRCYSSGLGVEKDEFKAFEYYRKSVEKGCVLAQHSGHALYHMSIILPIIYIF